MTDALQAAYIVKVTHAGTDLQESLTVFYAIIADNAEAGVQLVKQAVKDDAVVEVTDARLSQVTAHALGLAPGQARAL